MIRAYDQRYLQHGDLIYAYHKEKKMTERRRKMKKIDEEIRDRIRSIPYRFRNSKDTDVEKNVRTVALEICQLLEPKFNNSLEADAHNWDTREIELKPDELDALPQYAREAGYGTASRLLTDEEIRNITDKCEYPDEIDPYPSEKAVSKAQDAKTASILQAEFKSQCANCDTPLAVESKIQKAVDETQEKILKEIEEDFEDNDTLWTLNIAKFRWQAFKESHLRKQEGIDD